MSHEVETMFYARETPWHGLGQRVENALSSDEAIQMAGLEWDVFNVPLVGVLENQDVVEIPDRVANIRSSDKYVLGVVSNRYRIVQNREAFAFTDALLGGSRHVRYETAGSLFNGRQVWMLAKMDAISILGDDVAPYLVFTNSHDGSTGVRVAITPVRVVCNNTLTMAMDGATRVWSAMHTGNIDEKIEEARETLKRVETYLEKMPELAEALADINIYPDEVEKVLDQIFPTPEVEKEQSIRVKNVERMKETLFSLWTTTPDLQKFEGTAWGLYLACSDMVGHMKPLRETSTFQERRFTTIVEGHPVLQAAQKILMKVPR